MGVLTIVIAAGVCSGCLFLKGIYDAQILLPVRLDSIEVRVTTIQTQLKEVPTRTEMLQTMKVARANQTTDRTIEHASEHQVDNNK